jgi:hypothetical protein
LKLVKSLPPFLALRSSSCSRPPFWREPAMFGWANSRSFTGAEACGPDRFREGLRRGAAF